MGVVQKVEDGKFVESNSAASLANSKKKTGNDSLASRWPPPSPRL